MLSTAYYFLQVVVCSGILMTYYWFALRNKRFHQYNRFYLLFVLISSWIIPLVKINIQPTVTASTPIKLFTVIADNNTHIEEIVATQSTPFSWDAIAAIGYAVVCSLFLVLLIASLLKVYTLLKQNSATSIGNAYLILTNAKGTPFSFFKFIFWNEAIAPNSTAGMQMLQHELTHVQEKHSFDKLLMQLVIIVGWFNPFFWLAKKEMNMIHEFIADNKAIQNGDTAALATMLLTAAYPQQQFALSNPFFFSPIKRRIAMLTNNKNPRLSYVRRIIVLPLLATIVLFFAFRKKDDSKIEGKLNKVYTVVIDAGHGYTNGKADGAIATDGTTEDELVLQLANAIKAQNSNQQINIVLTRNDEKKVALLDRVAFAKKVNADLFVSLHVNAEEKNATTKSGVEIYFPKDTLNAFFSNSFLLGSAVADELGSIFSSAFVKKREKGVYVIDKNNCASVLIECGYITNKEDLALLTNKTKQKQIAASILNGINNYLLDKEGKNREIAWDSVGTWKKDGNIELKSLGFVIKNGKPYPEMQFANGAKMSFGEIKLDTINIKGISSEDLNELTKPFSEGKYVFRSDSSNNSNQKNISSNTYKSEPIIKVKAINEEYIEFVMPKKTIRFTLDEIGEMVDKKQVSEMTYMDCLKAKEEYLVRKALTVKAQ